MSQTNQSDSKIRIVLGFSAGLNEESPRARVCHSFGGFRFVSETKARRETIPRGCALAMTRTWVTKQRARVDPVTAPGSGEAALRGRKKCVCVREREKSCSATILMTFLVLRHMNAA